MDIALLWLNVLLPVLSIAIPVFATVYTVNNRIKNENRENHRPYLTLNKVDDIDEIDIYSYYLTPIGDNYSKEHPIIDYSEITSDNDISVKLRIKNIGYGVATNIKFYNLLTSTQVAGNQANSKEQNQKLFTTFDIASSEERSVQARVINLVKELEGETLEDHIKMLCIYQDLNENIYNFIININAKGNDRYDFSATQPSSKSYKKCIKENQKNYNEIIKKYKQL